MSDSQLKHLQDAISKSLVNLTRTTAQLAAEDLAYYRVSHPRQAKQLDKSNAKILQLSRRLLQNAAVGTAVEIPSFSNVDGLEDGWSSIVEVVDHLLEKTDITLDEFTGVIKKQQTEAEPPKKQVSHRAPYAQQSTIPKPQRLFSKLPENHPTGAFKPLLRSKPHPLVHSSDLLSTLSPHDRLSEYKHPYEEEIEHYQYPASVREAKDPIPPQPFSTTTATFVDSSEAVHRMLDELKTAKEIAVDLEHHDKHSYIGLVSLMQISTRDKDWIVDTLQPWREDLQILNEVFANPSILKVFHGASMDIIWLQRDLGLYVVGLFDTFHAATALQYERRSLAFLLDKFVNVKAQKQYQLADWRIRPLPSELLDYARSDTHYLLYIYDNMRNELIKGSETLPAGEDHINAVLKGSKSESLQKYHYQQYDATLGTGPDGWYNMLVRTRPTQFSKQQFSVFRAVHQWRDQVARDEDESTNFVMQRQILFNIARHMPTSPKDFFAIAPSLSDLLRGRVDDVINVVQNAIKAGETGPEMEHVLDQHPETVKYRERKAKEARISNGDFAVGDIIRRERNEQEAKQRSLETIQSRSSSFWGRTIPHCQAHSVQEAPVALLRLEVPLPPRLSSGEMSNHDLTSAETVPLSGNSTPSNRLTHLSDTSNYQPISHTQTTSQASFTPNETSSPTSPSQSQPADSMLQDHVSLNEQDSGERALKRARREARRAEKQRKQAEQAASEQAEAPFDYASAPSVLDAKAAKFAVQGANPYAKATDTSKGKPRVRREVAGKSMTFRK